MTVQRNIEALRQDLNSKDVGGGGTAEVEEWLSGAGAPAGTLGNVGDWYLDTATGNVWEKTGASTWTQRANIKGPTGAQGPQGIQGPQGTTGATGSQGPAGTPGEKWFTGSGAPAGATGVVGDWYLDSANGDYYEKTGASSWTLRGNLKGPQGPAGPTGADGVMRAYEQPGTPSDTTVGAIWIDTDDVPPVWVSPIPLVSALPSNPVDAQEVYYLADATNGVVWHLRYRATASGSYKWEFVGGPPLGPVYGTGGSITSNTPVLVNSASLVVPLAGDYVIGHSADLYAAAANTVYANLFVNGGNTSARIGISRIPSANGGGMTARTIRWPGTPAGATIDVRYAATGAPGVPGSLENSTLWAEPVRVG